MNIDESIPLWHREDESVRVEIEKIFPNFASLHKNTHIQTFVEYRPSRARLEITVYYREPNKEKFRLDLSFDEKDEHNLTPDKVTVEGLRPLVDFTRSTQ